MIVTQTPLRISFLGGGTDFPDFFLREEGWVLTTAIDKYIFVTIKERYDDRIRVGYTKTELVESIDELSHDLVRECLRKTGIHKRIEISTLGDIPSEGSGLGSSSTVTVGLLNAMYTYLGTPKEPETLAREACQIEIECLGKPIGLQDQYIAAYGGQRFIHFGRNGEVCLERLAIDREQTRRLNRSLMLFFTGITRQAASVLTEQRQNIPDRLPILREMKRLALEAKASVEAGEFDELGHLLDAGWQLKRQMASGVSNSAIDAMYDCARKAGAYGGKITGAGGGGYLLLYCPVSKQDDVRCALKHLTELPFSTEQDGSKVIFNYRRS
jgi:D-glycero-alpha-D-manno-heptose-7-phosphate kinase